MWSPTSRAAIMPEARVWALLWAAMLLAPERAFYVWLTRAPEQFRLWCAAMLPRVDPVTAVRRVFYGFKVVQFAVLAWWCGVFGPGAFSVSDPMAAVIGAVVLA